MFEDKISKPFFKILIMVMVVGFTLLGLNSCSDNNNWEDQQKNLTDLQHQNWVKQYNIENKKVEEGKKSDKRMDLYKRYVYLTKMQEQNMWNYRRAKLNKDADRQWKYWEKAQKLVAKTDAMIGELTFYFDEYKKEMKANLRGGYKIFHGLLYRLTREGVDEKKMNEEIKKAYNIF